MVVGAGKSPRMTVLIRITTISFLISNFGKKIFFFSTFSTRFIGAWVGKIMTLATKKSIIPEVSRFNS